jgi:hypothetical protein
MPLQNRVTPYGEIVALQGRGLMMGNRGILHDERREIVRPFQVRRWIACLLDFRGRRRTVMQPNRYTELFFLDEAAALSAGHRPCAECRHEDYRLFRSLWTARFGPVRSVDEIDARLHAERIARKKKVTYREEIANLPDGSYVVLERAPTLLWNGELHTWSDSGYVGRRARPAYGTVEVLTPRSIVEVLATGYRPSIHPTARERIGRA